MTFRAGQRVRISERAHRGHHRTPGYLKGKVGVVERVHDAFTNPETRAYGDSGLPKRVCYLVAFEQCELWQTYGGPTADRLYADVFQHWLEEAR